MSEAELKTVGEFIASKFTQTNIDEISTLGFCLGVSPVSHRIIAHPDNWMGYVRAGPPCAHLIVKLLP